MKVIETRPHRWGWKAFEAPGVEPVFPKKDDAIDYAQNRACFRSGEVWISIQPEISRASFLSTMRIGSCECTEKSRAITNKCAKSDDRPSVAKPVGRFFVRGVWLPLHL
jgi:hypothetical protein